MVRLKLGHVHITVRDLKSTLGFYESLGFKIGRIPTDGGEYVYIALDKGSIEPTKSKIEPGTKGITIGIGVDNVEDVYRIAKARRVKIIDDIKDRPWGVRSFYIRDPDGYIVEFEQEIKSK